MSGPLSGMKVLDITRVVAGPFCSMMLADLGATVIKVESPDEPDYVRTFPPMMGTGPDRISGFFAQYNRNKMGITINLSSEEGKKLFKDLAAKVDVVLENFRPGVMKKLGVGYEVLSAINPSLVYAAISGYGQTGPYSRRPAYDNSGQATSGLWSINGYPDRPPVRVGTIIGDISATLFGTIGILAAYHHAKSTGQGQMVDVAQLDSTFALTESAVVKYTMANEIQGCLGNLHPFVYPYELFNAKDGYIFFGGYTDKFFKLTCEFFKEPEFAELPETKTMQARFDQKNYNGLIKPKLEDWFSRYTAAELEEGLAELVPLSKINNIADAINDPQINSRNMVISSQYPEGEIRSFGQPIKLEKTPCNTSGLAPKVGEHNGKIFSEYLGLSEHEINELKAKGAI